MVLIGYINLPMGLKWENFSWKSIFGKAYFMVVVGLMIYRRKANMRQWFSGKIHRCHRWAPGSIPGWRNFVYEDTTPGSIVDPVL
jgi:hypothetical protein